MILVDGHGEQDLFACQSDLSELKVVKLRSGNDIQGFTLNSLLRGIFISLSAKSKEIYGGLSCWELVIEPMYTCLLCIATVDEIMSRVIHINRRLFINRESALMNEAHGSLAFVYYWLYSFHPFISDLALQCIHDNVVKLNSILAVDGGENYCDCHQQYNRVTQTSVDILRRRLGPHSFHFSSFVSCNPNVTLTTGQWTGREVLLRRAQFKESMAAAPQLKLEIFGGDQLMDGFDDDSDIDHETAAAGAPDRGQRSTHEHEAPAPLPHIQEGLSLLQPPASFALDLLHMDALELARQWTLVDHALFLAIPLHSLLPGAPATHSQARHHLLRCGTGASGTGGGVRRFIDRFNSLSSWVTHAVLSRRSPQDRGAVVSFFVRVAGHLHALHNFNGVMAVVAALQQGSVSRLKLTFRNVPKSECGHLAKLQKLMSGDKNYQNYREEVVRLAQSITAQRSQETRAGGPDDIESSMEWRKFLYEHDAVPSDSGSLGSTSVCAAGGEFPVAGGFCADGDDLQLEAQSRVGAIVPHIGSLLAELTSVADGNSDFLADSPHLYNAGKFRLLAATLTGLRKMQAMRYNLEPVRAVAAALNHTLRAHLKLTRAAEVEHSQRMFALSRELESDEDIAAGLHPGADSGGEDNSERNLAVSRPMRVAFAEESSGPAAVAVNGGARPKYRKSDAYESIVSGTTARRASFRDNSSPKKARRGLFRTDSSRGARGDNSGEEEEDDDSTGDADPAGGDPKTAGSSGRSLLRKASTLLRTMSFAGPRS